MAATVDAREVIGEATLAELEATLRGRLARPADPDYDQVCAVWNAAHDRRPALVVRCTGTADVIRAVEFARSEGLAVAVRGGAHSIAGFSTTDGGVVVDLSPMKGIRVDPAAGGRSPSPGSPGWSSTTRRRRSGWRSPVAWCPAPASPASPSAAGSAGCCASTA